MCPRGTSRDPGEVAVRFKLSIPPDSKVAGIVHDVALRIGQEHGFTPRQAESMARAVDEAVAEGFYEPPPDSRVDLCFRCEADRMEIGVFYPAPMRLGDGRGRRNERDGVAASSGMDVEQHFERGMVHHRLVRRRPCRRGKS
jgi:hypothetical protein